MSPSFQNCATLCCVAKSTWLSLDLSRGCALLEKDRHLTAQAYFWPPPARVTSHAVVCVSPAIVTIFRNKLPQKRATNSRKASLEGRDNSFHAPKSWVPTLQQIDGDHRMTLEYPSTRREDCCEARDNGYAIYLSRRGHLSINLNRKTGRR